MPQQACSTKRASHRFTIHCDFEEARAVALLAKYVAMHPDNERYAGVLAGIQERRPENRYREQSIQVSRDAIAAGASGFNVSVNLVYALADAGRIDEAREIYDTFRRAQGANAASKSSQRLFALLEAWIHFNNKEYAKADEIIRRDTATSPLREDAEFFLVGRMKLGMRRYDEAIAVFNDGLKRATRSCRLWYQLGAAYATKGDVATALATFDKAIAAVPKCGLNYNEAARLLIKQNRAPAARQKLETLIKSASNSDGAVIAKEILAGIGTKS